MCVCKKPLHVHLWMTPRSKCVLCCLNYMWQQASKLAIYSLSPWSLEQYLGQSCSLSISFPSAIHCFCCSKEQHAVEVHASVLRFLLQWHISVQGEWNNPKSLPAASCTKANIWNPGQNQHCKNYCQETTFRSCKLGKKREGLTASFFFSPKEQ